jgi:hypothetical protein
MTFQLLTGSTAAGVAAAMSGDAPGTVRTAPHVTHVTTTSWIEEVRLRASRFGGQAVLQRTTFALACQP